jgi:DNA-binding NarL/FixJ family response regulator
VSGELLEAGCRNILVVGNCVLRRGVAGIVRDVVPSASIVEASYFSDAKARLGADDFLAAFFDIGARDLGKPTNFRMLRADHPRLIVAVLSLTDEASVILSYIAAGVNGYIFAWSSQSEIECAIGTVLARSVYVPPHVMGAEADRPDQAPEVPSPRRNPSGLTKRQNAVLSLLRDGYSNKEIARELDLSPHTVKIYVSALLRHFSVARRADLAIATSRTRNERVRRYDRLSPRQQLEMHA